MIGLIGGSGIYEALDLDAGHEETVETPFGAPSGSVTVGELDGREIAFLPRHGPDHELSPTEVPYRANIYALKQLGVDRVLATNAVGSLREELPPQTLVVPDQLFDRTRHRTTSFFGDGMVVHMGFAEPYCPHMTSHLAAAAETVDDGAGAGSGAEAGVEEGGTYVCIEGPQYSTRAESEFYRAQGWDIVGMTAVPEAKLAREAELCYATVAGVTDYDVWKEDSEVSLQEVLDNAAANEERINATIRRAIETMPDERDCDCAHALDGTINTAAEAIPDETRERLTLLAGDYLD
ncbi:S-methyl-5'-thioadenosine phosphorylase [Halococcus dombrowskii]|uniref:Purine nucleoside phosphorylase n=1 Tax=Halococcus dombrowskii TaxID=179637 RepID=A0AAX3ATT8_HALDO|nr:S-methyl-5'-thioadenosine phosphorylase [Halococcus dombrowskii]UOO96098.1 S-methyl-5'-thioadenosine phosphorylase [Halococcus dombrowskii]